MVPQSRCASICCSARCVAQSVLVCWSRSQQWKAAVITPVCVSIHCLGRFSAIAALPIRKRPGRYRNLTLTLTLSQNLPSLHTAATTHVYVRYMLSPVRLSSVVCRLSVVCLSVGNTCAPYSGGCNFRQYFYGIWYVGHPLTSRKILRRSSQGNPSVGELNTRGIAKYSDFHLRIHLPRRQYV